MPTHEELPLFMREWKKLSHEQQILFLAAVEEMVEDLRALEPLSPFPTGERGSRVSWRL